MMNTVNPPFFKIIIVGEAGVGKTSLLMRYIKGNFSNDYNLTLGFEFASKDIEIDGASYKLQVWDTAGQETFKSIIRTFYRNVDAVMLVYDLTKKKTFEQLEFWLTEVKNYANK